MRIIPHSVAVPCGARHRSAALGLPSPVQGIVEGRECGGPKDHINIIISHSGSRAQYEGGIRNHAWQDPYVYVVLWAPRMTVMMSCISPQSRKTAHHSFWAESSWICVQSQSFSMVGPTAWTLGSAMLRA